MLETGHDLQFMTLAPEKKVDSVFEKAKLYEEEGPVLTFFHIKHVETSKDNKTRFEIPLDSAKKLFGIKERGGKEETGFNSGSIGNERVTYSINVPTAEGDIKSQPYSVTSLENRGGEYKTTGTVEVRHEMDGETYKLPFKVENSRVEGDTVTITFEAPMDDVIQALEVAKKGTEIADGVQAGKDIDKARKEEAEKNHDAKFK